MVTKLIKRHSVLGNPLIVRLPQSNGIELLGLKSADKHTLNILAPAKSDLIRDRDHLWMVAVALPEEFSELHIGAGMLSDENQLEIDEGTIIRYSEERQMHTFAKSMPLELEMNPGACLSIQISQGLSLVDIFFFEKDHFQTFTRKMRIRENEITF